MIEDFARQIHNDYVKSRLSQGDTIKTNPSLVEFQDLPDDLKKSNLQNAAHIPVKLKSVGFTIIKVDDIDSINNPDFNNSVYSEKVDQMAYLEHERWVNERKNSGWRYKEGPKDSVNKTSPYIISYNELPEDIKEYDREIVRIIPELLKQAGYKIVE